MGACFSTIKRVSSFNALGDILTSSEDEDRPIRRIPSLRYLKKRRGSVNKYIKFLLRVIDIANRCKAYHRFNSLLPQISAESGHTSDLSYKLPVHPKPEATAARIRAVVKDISFFRGKNRRDKEETY